MELKVLLENYGKRVFNTQDLGDLKTTGQQCLVGEIKEHKLATVLFETRLRLEKFQKEKRAYLESVEDENPKVLEYYEDMCTIIENRLKRLEALQDKVSRGNSLVYAKNHMLVKDCIGLSENEELVTNNLVKYKKDHKYPHVYSVKIHGKNATEYIDALIRRELEEKGFGSALDRALKEKGLDTTFVLMSNLTFMYRDFKDGLAPDYTFKTKKLEDCQVSNLEDLKVDLKEYGKIITESILDKDGVKFINKDCGNGLSTDLVYNFSLVLKVIKTGIYKTIISKLGVYPLYFIDGKLVVGSLKSLKNLDYDLSIVMGDNCKIEDYFSIELKEIY